MLWVMMTSISACIPSYAITFRAHEPQPDCMIEIADASADELASTYERIGSVCLGSIRFDEAAPLDIVRRQSPERYELFKKACRMGGRVVALSGHCTVADIDAVEFAVLGSR